MDGGPVVQRHAPLHEDPSLHRVHYAAELWLLVGAPHRSSNPLGEGRRQPIGDLRGHAVRLQLLEVILRLQALPVSGEKIEEKKNWMAPFHVGEDFSQRQKDSCYICLLTMCRLLVEWCRKT